MRFHHTTQNVAQFITYELFTSRIFHSTFLDLNLSWVTETGKKAKLQIRGKYCIALLAGPSALEGVPHGLGGGCWTIWPVVLFLVH